MRCAQRLVPSRLRHSLTDDTDDDFRCILLQMVSALLYHYKRAVRGLGGQRSALLNPEDLKFYCSIAKTRINDDGGGPLPMQRMCSLCVPMSTILSSSPVS